MTKLCIVSHSGGLDSSTLMAKALAEGMVVQPITFNYGQTNIIEGMAQEKVWAIYKERYKDNIRQTIELDIGELLGSIKSQYQSIRDSGKVEDKTELEFYTPFRNLVFSSLAAMVGEIVCFTEDIDELYVGIGVHKHSSDSYKKDYNVTYSGKKTISGIPVDIITMKPVKANGLKSVTLYVNTPQKKLIKLEQISTNNDLAVISINNYKENQTLSPSIFSFDKTKYQNYLITEL